MQAHAQSAPDTFALYIAPNTALYVNGNLQMAIMSNVKNGGMFGTVPGSTVHMLGDTWRNLPGSVLPDENGTTSTSGTGGIFRFASVFPQYISGGFSVAGKIGASFPNITVANTRGVYLFEDTWIRSILQFEKGMFWLNGSNLQLGVSGPGTISNYSASNFIGTANTVKGGFLYRSKISNSSGTVVFPIGAQANSYAPVAIMFNTSTPQDLHVRSFDEVYSNAFLGTKGDPASLQQTWNIGQENTTAVPSIIAFQHDLTREGPGYTTHRGNSYVSMYNFNTHAWDTLPPSGFSTPGTLTTGTLQANTFISTRTFDSLGTNSYFTKTANTRTDSITLSKAAMMPVLQSDESFLVTYMFLVRNTSTLPTTSVHVYDTLSTVFPSPAVFSVNSVTATGSLLANNIFDGVSVTDMLLPASTLSARTTDTIILKLTVKPNKKDSYYYNKANLAGTINGSNNSQYVFNNPSVDGLTPPAPGAPSVPTPIALNEPRYKMPEGFSPNGDGINDRLVIANLGSDKAQIWIFNKQGSMVYRNSDYKNDWDGTYNQNLGGGSSFQKVEEGTYFYKIIITELTTGKEQTFYGYFSLWR